MTTSEAIQVHGAKAVYTAAHRHMAGDVKLGLATAGLSAHTMGDVWQSINDARAELGPLALAIEAAEVSAELNRIAKRNG